MATKKITELGLIDEVTDGVNLVGDDAIQTYRMTALQLKNYIDSALKARLDAIEADDWLTSPRISDLAVKQAHLNDDTKFKYRTKFLASDVGSNGSTFLSFDGLTIGKTYSAICNISFYSTLTGTVGAAFYNNASGTSNFLGLTKAGVSYSSATVNFSEFVWSYKVAPFVASATTFRGSTVFVQSGDEVRGDGSVNHTHITLIEHPTNWIEDLTL